MSSHKRIKIREQVSKTRGVEPVDLKFASNIEDYSLYFNSIYFNLMDVYDAHFDKIQWDWDIDDEEDEDEAKYNPKGEMFSATENEISTLRLNSRYLGNIVYLIDISLPNQTELTLDNDPVVEIKTGTGKHVFKGTFKFLEKSKEDLIEKSKL
jgi:hypothetical protein